MELDGLIPPKPNSTGISDDLELSNGSILSIKDSSAIEDTEKVGGDSLSEVQQEASTVSKLFSPEEEDSFYNSGINPGSRSFNVIETEFKFLKDYDSSVSRKCEVIDISTTEMANSISCDSFESTQEPENDAEKLALPKKTRDLITIKSYRDSQRSQVSKSRNLIYLR